MAGRRAATRRGRPRISFEDMAARRAERLVNLVICLLSTRQFLTAERVRDAVPGYEPADGDPRTDEAFKRMFERDKAELRDLGIPLETGRNSIFDAEDVRTGPEIKAIRVQREEPEMIVMRAMPLWRAGAAISGLAKAVRNRPPDLRSGGDGPGRCRDI